ncbi:MAG: DUF5906 domain-containing protein [Shewanella sp.]
MLTLQHFIDLGWHTVPLSGKLARNDDGTKTLPDFEKDWRIRYTENRNTRDAKLGGVLTGKVSNIIAIDCDNPATYAVFKALDPDYQAVAVSFGKYSEPTGTFIYAYDEALPDGFKLHEDAGFSVDFYSNNGFIYLPVVGNKTKLAWTEIPAIKPMPPQVKILVQQLAKKHVNKDVRHVTNVVTARCLQPLVKTFVEQGEFMPGLFKIITPRDFRELDQYVKEGYLHPDNVPQGRGSEYLSKVSAILGADISIDDTLYTGAMTLINSLWSNPMDHDTLDSTILDPMLERKASINGKPIWQFDAEWKRYTLVLSSKRQSSFELGFDDRRAIYYVVDMANTTYQAFDRDSELMAYLEAAAVNVPKKVELKKSLPIVNVVTRPNEDFGYISGADPTARDLNLFIQTPELAILNDPQSYASKYTRPDTILRFMETLIPEEVMRNYVLSFIKYKFKHFTYSPVILYFLGVHGSGKDTFVKILESIIGTIARPTVKEFLEIFNGYMLDNYFVQLDEFGNQLTRADEKEEALGKLKAYSGKSQISIRTMRTNGFQYNHNVTFISTANKNPLVLEDGDRRMAIISTPNKLSEADWVIALGGVSNVQTAIFKELKDFCYWLATECPSITASEFVTPPESEHKHKVIADSMFAAQKLAYCIKQKMWPYLLDLARDHHDTKFENALRANCLTTVELNALYDSMTDYKGNPKSLMRELKNAGLELTPSTHNGERTYKVQVEIPTFMESSNDEDYPSNI